MLKQGALPAAILASLSATALVFDRLTKQDTLGNRIVRLFDQTSHPCSILDAYTIRSKLWKEPIPTNSQISPNSLAQQECSKWAQISSDTPEEIEEMIEEAAEKSKIIAALTNAGVPLEEALTYPLHVLQTLSTHVFSKHTQELLSYKDRLLNGSLTEEMLTKSELNLMYSCWNSFISFLSSLSSWMKKSMHKEAEQAFINKTSHILTLADIGVPHSVLSKLAKENSPLLDLMIEHPSHVKKLLKKPGGLDTFLNSSVSAATKALKKEPVAHFLKHNAHQ
jgi:hypothetical protein